MLPKALQNPGSRTDLEGGGGARGRGSLGHPDDALSPYEGALMERPLWRSPYGEALIERPYGEALWTRPYGDALMEEPYGDALMQRSYEETLRKGPPPDAAAGGAGAAHRGLC